jgi:hypothetical protein
MTSHMTNTLNNPRSLAYQRGRRAAEARATHTKLPTTIHYKTAQLIAMLEVDPESVEEFIPRKPDLSGEWADSETPQTLVRAVTGAGAIGDEEMSTLCCAWERGVSDHFYGACITELRRKSERRVAS